MMQLGCDGGKHFSPESCEFSLFLYFSVRRFGNLLGNFTLYPVCFSGSTQPFFSPVTLPSEPAPSSKR